MISFSISDLVKYNSQVRDDRINSVLDELVKSLNEQCKKYGLRAKLTALVELPFGNFKLIVVAISFQAFSIYYPFQVLSSLFMSSTLLYDIFCISVVDI